MAMVVGAVCRGLQLMAMCTLCHDVPEKPAHTLESLQRSQPWRAILANAAGLDYSLQCFVPNCTGALEYGRSVSVLHVTVL